MEIRECPDQKITIIRYFLSFLPVSFFFFILLYAGQLGSVENLLIVIICFQAFVGTVEIVSEYNSTREDWKHPQPGKQCREPPASPPWLFWFRTNIGESLALYNFYITFRYIRKGWNAAVEKPEFNSRDDHDAIIVMIYSCIGREFHFQEIDLLIEFFTKKGINYKVYCCENYDDFFNVVNNPQAKKLWIFGHGYRGGVRTGNRIVIYSELINNLSINAKNKDYIYQFHCNNGCEKSLADYLSCGQGFANYKSLLRGGGVRGYIKNIFKDKSW